MISALQCPHCASTTLQQTPDAVICGGFTRRFPIEQSVVNTLVEPDSEVVRELQGMLQEAHHRNEPYKTIEELIDRRQPHVTNQQEREDGLKGQPRNYYLSTRLNVERAIRSINLPAHGNVLEIGGENEFPFLTPFRDRGMDCYVVNIHFAYDDPEKFVHWPNKIAGDMNHLPFRDGFFDVVLTSATTHHSGDLDRTVAEIARVTKPGGNVLILNDPLCGTVKHMWERLSGAHQYRQGGDRNDLIHENEYSLGLYRRLFRKHGLRIEESFFSEFYDQKLSSSDVSGVRWAPVAKLVSMMWRVPPLRSAILRFGLPLGQRVLGLEMNMILARE